MFSFFGASSQDYTESALIFGRTKPSGSARILGLGGAQTALGGDYSSALSNPAGLGMFNKPEFTFSLGYTDHQTSAGYYGTTTDDNRSIFNIPGFSYVWHFPNNSENFISGSLGVSFSRVNDFNRAVSYSGSNAQASIIDTFIEQANGFTTEQFEEDEYHYNTPTGLAYHNFLIGPRSTFDPNEPDDIYFTDAPSPDLQTEMEDVLVKGSSNQWSISYGGNIQDKFFFGAGVGITSLKYNSQKSYREEYDSDILINMHLVENLIIRGTGINATLGAIYRPANFLQVGVSYTSPTFFGLSETYDASMSTRWNNFDYFGDGSEILGDNSDDPIATDIVTSDYTLRIPMKLTTGVAFISQFGFLTADVQFTNPSRSKYTSDITGLSFDSENENIKTTYQPVINYRIGAEFRYEIFRARAGFAVESNAYSERLTADNQITSLSGGLGIRKKNFFIDLAIIHSQGDSLYQPFSFNDGSGPIAEFKNRTINGLITVGFSL
jgi:hypothetical protein